VLVRGVRHGGDEAGDDLQFVLGKPVQDGVGAVAERAEEGQAGGLALVGVAQVDDPVVGGVVTGAADVPGLLETVDDQAGAAGGQAELLTQLPGGQRRAIALRTHDGHQGAQVGGLEAVQLGEGVADPARVRAVPAQRVDDDPPQPGLFVAARIEVSHLVASPPRSHYMLIK
jgi:hypothetical protein